MVDALARLSDEQQSALLEKIKRDEISELRLCSYSQQRLWFVSQLDPESVAYNIAVALRLSGELDREALQRAVREVVRRHEVLRTRFVTVGGEPLQWIEEEVRAEIVVEDLQEEQEKEAVARRIEEVEAERPFDLVNGPLLRLRLLQLAEQEHELLVTMHHIVSDGWSMGVLVQEVNALYSAYVGGEESPLPELAIQYADYAVWQRQWLSGRRLEEQLEYWRRQLAGLMPLELPTDHSRPPRLTTQGRWVH